MPRLRQSIHRSLRPRLVRIAGLAFVLAALVPFASPLVAQTALYSTTVTVSPDASSVDIPFLDLGSVTSLVRGPVDGSLLVLSDRYRYVLDDDFRSLGYDRFIVGRVPGHGEPPGDLTVHLVLAEGRTVIDDETFETPQAVQLSGGGTVAITKDAAFEGMYGLEVENDGFPGYLHWLPGWVQPDDAGGVQGVADLWDEPIEDLQTPIFETVGGGSQSPIRLVVEQNGTLFTRDLILELWDEVSQTYLRAPALALENGPARFVLNWWFGSQASATLRLESLATTVRGAQLQSSTITAYDIGVLQPGGSNAPLGLYFDSLEVLAADVYTTDRLLAADDFSRQAIERWQVTPGPFLLQTDGTDLSIAGGGSPLWLASTFAAVPELGVRLRLDPSLVSQGAATVLGLGRATNPADAATSADVTLSLRSETTGGTFCLDLASMESRGPRTVSACGLSSAPHEIGIQWRESIGKKRPNGSARLWVDGVPVAFLRHLDNFGEDVEWVRIGLDGSSLSGSVSYDDVGIWN